MVRIARQLTLERRRRMRKLRNCKHALNRLHRDYDIQNGKNSLYSVLPLIFTNESTI